MIKGNMDDKALIDTAVRALDMKKGENIRVRKVADLTIITDYFIIVEAGSTTHTRALADDVEYQLKRHLGIDPEKIEGNAASGWMIIDYGSVLIHVFERKTREFYSLERLWQDGEYIDISNILLKGPLKTISDCNTAPSQDNIV